MVKYSGLQSFAFSKAFGRRTQRSIFAICLVQEEKYDIKMNHFLPYSHIFLFASDTGSVSPVLGAGANIANKTLEEN